MPDTCVDVVIFLPFYIPTVSPEQKVTYTVAGSFLKDEIWGFKLKPLKFLLHIYLFCVHTHVEIRVLRARLTQGFLRVPEKRSESMLVLCPCPGADFKRSGLARSWGQGLEELKILIPGNLDFSLEGLWLSVLWQLCVRDPAFFANSVWFRFLLILAYLSSTNSINIMLYFLINLLLINHQIAQFLLLFSLFLIPGPLPPHLTIWGPYSCRFGSSEDNFQELIPSFLA